MKKTLPAPLLRKYLSGQCTPEEETLVEEWYASFENNAGYTESLSQEEKQQLKDTIRQRIPARRGTIRRLSWVATGIAASLLLAFYLYSGKVATYKTTTIAANVDITMSNATAAIKENTLSDGSHVWLMPGAAITYRRIFSGNHRNVHLDGEAFFEVTKNPARPFIIYSNHLITTVWGTSFRVRDGKFIKFADVTVLTGKVSVKLLHAPKKEVMIYPSQKATYLRKEQTLTEEPKADMTAMALWQKPDVSFNNRPLKEVIPVLNESFKININARDEKINNLLLTADFNGLNFPEIMQMLHKVLDIDYTINGQNVQLTTNNNP